MAIVDARRGHSRSAISAGVGMFGAIQSAAPSLAVEATPVNVRDAGQMDSPIAAFARSANGGLIVTASALAFTHRDLIVSLAGRHNLPAIYFARTFVVAGGLATFSPGHYRPVPARGRLR